MPLPVLSHHASTDADLVRLFLRTERIWSQQLGEAEQLESGLAIYSTELADVRTANRLLEAAVVPDTTPAALVSEVHRFYADHGLRCLEIVPDSSASSERTERLANHLLAAGYARHAQEIMAWSKPTATAIPPPEGVMVLPARAALRQVRRLAEEAACGHTPQLIEAQMQHLDDPHCDALVAMRGGKAVGRVVVLAVGDVGRVDQVFVVPEARRAGIGRLLVARALEICLRSQFRHVLLSVWPDNEAAIALYAAFGFRKVGQTPLFRSR